MYCLGCSKPLNLNDRTQVAGFGDPMVAPKWRVICPECYEEHYLGEEDVYPVQRRPLGYLFATRDYQRA